MNAEASGTGNFYYCVRKLDLEVQFRIGPLESEAAILKETLLRCKKQAPPFFVVCARCLG